MLKKITLLLGAVLCTLAISAPANAGTGWGQTPWILTSSAPVPGNPFALYCGYTAWITFNNNPVQPTYYVVTRIGNCPFTL